MRSVVRRTLVGGSLAAAVALLFWLDRFAPEGIVPWFAASLLSCVGALEVARMFGGRPLAALFVPALALALLSSPLGAELGWVPSDRPLAAYLFGALLVAVAAAAIALLGRGRKTGGSPAFAAAMAVWVLPALHGWVWIDARWGVAGLFLLVLLSKIGDIFGYFVGRRIGVRHPFPGISPNKTVAGCVASLLAGVAAGAALAAWEVPGPWRAGVPGGALAGLLLNVAAQAGDLLESWVKRRAGVKDSGALFGPSGGVLDVVDSLLTTTPLALVVLPAVL